MKIKKNGNFKSIDEYIKSKFVDAKQYHSYPYMDEAVKLFIKHIDNDSKIVVYGDYDADGITSLLIFNLIKEATNANITLIAPDRFSDGYGLNMTRAESFVNDNVNLVVLVDNGIVACDEVSYLVANNVDVIVLDHHEGQKNYVRNDTHVVVCDPHVTGGEFDDLCGAGLSYMFLLECKHKHISFSEEMLNTANVLSMIGTVADMVSMTSDNHKIVKDGLDLFNNNKKINPVLRNFILSCSKNNITEEDIAFKVAPVFNAMGRLIEFGASEVVALLSKNVLSDEIYEKTDKIIKTNEIRKEMVNNYFSKLDVKTFNDDTTCIVVKDNEIPAGICGLLASKFVEKYNRPAIVLSGTEILKGSARSCGNINLFDALTSVNKYFISYGGHKEACGLSLRASDYNYFVRDINICVPRTVPSDVMFYDIYFDGNNPKEIVDTLNKYAPFGVGFEKPRFLMKFNKDDIKKVQVMGKLNEHVKFIVNDTCVVKFNHNGNCSSDNYVAIGNLSVNEFKGTKTYQLNAYFLEKEDKCKIE